MQTLFLQYNPSYMRKPNPEDIMDKRRNETVERFISRIRAEIYNLAPVDDYLEVLRNDLYEYQENNWIIRVPCPCCPDSGNRKSVFKETAIPMVETFIVNS